MDSMAEEADSVAEVSESPLMKSNRKRRRCHPRMSEPSQVSMFKELLLKLESHPSERAKLGAVVLSGCEVRGFAVCDLVTWWP